MSNWQLMLVQFLFWKNNNHCTVTFSTPSKWIFCIPICQMLCQLYSDVYSSNAYIVSNALHFQLQKWRLFSQVNVCTVLRDLFRGKKKKIEWALMTWSWVFPSNYDLKTRHLSISLIRVLYGTVNWPVGLWRVSGASYTLFFHHRSQIGWLQFGIAWQVDL